MAKGTHDPRYRELIDCLATARKAAGLSQAALAQQLGSRQQFVSKYESGERRLDIVEFVDVAKTLNVDWVALLKSNA